MPPKPRRARRSAADDETMTPQTTAENPTLPKTTGKLTKDNLKSLNTAVRRGKGQRRGPSPSPSPDLQDDDSLNSEGRRNQQMLLRNSAKEREKNKNGPVDNTIDLIKEWCQINQAAPWGTAPLSDLRLQVPVDQTAMNGTSEGEAVSSRQDVVEPQMDNAYDPAKQLPGENEATPRGLAPEEQERDTLGRDLTMVPRNPETLGKQGAFEQTLEQAKNEPPVQDPWGTLMYGDLARSDVSESRSGPWEVYEEPKSKYYARKAKAAALAEADEALKNNKPKQRAANQKVKESASRALPPDFPVYRATSNLNEVAAFLANASCFVSLGGRPSGDLKYTIIAVPAGEEELLLGRHQPAPEDGAQREAFLDAIAEARRAYNHGELDNDPYLHDVDNDSEEFARHRIGDDFSDAPFEEFQGAEKPPLSQAESVESDVDAEETEDEAPRKRRKVVEADNHQAKPTPTARRTPRKNTDTTPAKGVRGRPTRNSKGVAPPKDEATPKPKVGRPAKKETTAKKRGRAANG